MPTGAALFRLFAPIYISFALVLIVSVAVLQARGISITPESWKALAITIALATTLAGAPFLCRSEIARLAGLSLAAFVSMPAPLSLLSYAAASLGARFPLQDAGFAAIDKAIGLDWLAFVALVNEWPTLVHILKAGYHYTIAAVIYALAFLNVIRRADRVAEFVWAMFLTCIVANIVSALLPANGAYVWHAPAADIRSAISADSGVWHLQHYEALRAGTFRFFDLARTEGLVTFPSYHTAMALLIPLALRGFGVVTALGWIFAAIVVVSTIPIGGHYLIDVICGVALAVACVAVLAHLRARQASRGGAHDAMAAPAKSLSPAPGGS